MDARIGSLEVRYRTRSVDPMLGRRAPARLDASHRTRTSAEALDSRLHGGPRATGARSTCMRELHTATTCSAGES